MHTPFWESYSDVRSLLNHVLLRVLVEPDPGKEAQKNADPQGAGVSGMPCDLVRLYHHPTAPGRVDMMMMAVMLRDRVHRDQGSVGDAGKSTLAQGCDDPRNYGVVPGGLR